MQQNPSSTFPKKHIVDHNQPQRPTPWIRKQCQPLAANSSHMISICEETRADNDHQSPQQSPPSKTISAFASCGRTHVFTGGHNRGGWLLKDTKQAGKGWFRAGLVVAPPEMVSSPGPDGLDVTLHHYEAFNNTDGPETMWSYARKCFSITLRGTDPNISTVLLLHHNQQGYISMRSIPGYTETIDVDLSQLRPTQTEQLVKRRPDVHDSRWPQTHDRHLPPKRPR